MTPTSITRTPHATATRPLRVLVAEDNVDHLFFIKRALEELPEMSFVIDTARDGEEALQRLRLEGGHADSTLPDLILLDLKMPKVGGLEVLRSIKGDTKLRRIPVMVLSSSERAEDVNTAYDYGTNAYLSKGSSMADLAGDLRAAADFWTQTAVIPDTSNESAN